VQLEVLNPLEHAAWNDHLSAFSGECFFNTVEWARVLSETYGFKPCYIGATEHGRRTALLPLMDVDSWLTGRRGVALPFSDACEPFGVTPNMAEDVLRDLREMGTARGWRYFEIKNGGCFRPDIPPSSTYLRHTLDLLPGAQRLFERLKGSVRTAIRKAESAGVRVFFSSASSSIADFCQLHCETRRRHGLPPQPVSFFRNLQRHVLGADRGVVVTAVQGQRPIAGAVFCHIGQQALFKYGASDWRFQGLRGSTLVMWEAIKWHAERGYRQLSLGRTAPGNEGLRRFKLGWGATESVLHYVRFDFRRQEFVTDDGRKKETGYRLVRQMPLGVLRLAGRVFYKHMG
jgi:hypothetical protein